MQIQIIKPSLVLSSYIRHYWVLSTTADENEVCERVIPTGNVELMFHYKNPFIIKTSANSDRQHRSFISGISSNFTDVATSGESGVIAVTFHPLGACNFFRFPMIDAENANVNLFDVNNREIHDIEDQICEDISIRDRISIIEKYLISHLKPVYKDELLLMNRAVNLIDQSNCLIHASKLADKLSLSGKTLERKFNTLIGKSPKQFIRIKRFQNIINNFLACGKDNFTDIGYENGYFDQAHFIKDFKSMSGYTPGEFINKYPCKSEK